tara:strand:- start:463 stop:870 length:408 start_codon:yes stop_codon:yes gene_type:complete
MIGYSPKFPLQFDNYVGAYALNTTLKEVIKQNFINLMLTTPGERIMDINFGAGLRRYLFEQKTQNLTGQIASTIRAQVKKYMPFIALGSVAFGDGETLENEQILIIKVDYSIPKIGVTDSVVLGDTNLMVTKNSL